MPDCSVCPYIVIQDTPAYLKFVPFYTAEYDKDTKDQIIKTIKHTSSLHLKEKEGNIKNKVKNNRKRPGLAG